MSPNMLLFAGLALSAVLQPYVAAAKVAAPFKFPSKYTIKYLWSLPEVQKVQSKPLKYPITVAYDGDNNRVKVDVYNGMGVTMIDGDNNVVTYPRVDEMVCDSFTDTVGPSMLRRTPGTSTGGVVDAPFPSMDEDGWEYKGPTKYHGKAADKWVRAFTEQDKTNTYTFLFDAKTQQPLQLHIMGYNILGASHYDEYVADIVSYTPGVAADSEFKVACNTRLHKRVEASPEVRRSQIARAMLMMPWSRIGSAPEMAAAHQEVARIAAFAEAAREVASHDERAAGFSVRLNHFADMPAADFEHVMLGRRAAGQRIAGAKESSLGVFKATMKKADLPKSVDYRNTGYDNYGTVKTQADCGSCWSFAATGAMEGAWFKATGQAKEFSEQHLMDCSWDYGNAACDGGLVEQTMDFVAQYGVVEEKEYQYLGVNAFCNKNATNPKAEKKGFFSGYTAIDRRDDTALMEALYTHGPLAVSMDAGGKLFKYYGQGVYDDPSCGNSDWDLNHAVTLLGYGTDEATGKDYWIIRNSWSKLWGFNGYAYIVRGEGDCGITTNAAMAVVKAEFVKKGRKTATKPAPKKTAPKPAPKKTA